MISKTRANMIYFSANDVISAWLFPWTLLGPQNDRIPVIMIFLDMTKVFIRVSDSKRLMNVDN